MPSIAIIGTAGRKEDAGRLDIKVFDQMVEKAEDVITNTWKLEWNDVVLRSGGAAYSDHVAIVLFNKYKPVYEGLKLELDIPCKW
jgi:hypothetical protein